MIWGVTRVTPFWGNFHLFPQTIFDDTKGYMDGLQISIHSNQIYFLGKALKCSKNKFPWVWIFLILEMVGPNILPTTYEVVPHT